MKTQEQLDEIFECAPYNLQSMYVHAQAKTGCIIYLPVITQKDEDVSAARSNLHEYIESQNIADLRKDI